MIIINCKNLFTYPDGSIYTGQEILDFINYHTTHQTGKTKIATYMKRKFGNIKPDMSYKFFSKWSRSPDEYDVTVVNKPRLLRVDHTSPVYESYNYFYKKFENVRYEGCVEIKV